VRIFLNRGFIACLAGAAVVGISCVIASAGFFYDDGTTTMHFAFEGNPNGDWPVVRPPGFYHADDGFGFVDSPALLGTADGVTAPKYFRFDANLPDGNYDVAVTLGGTPGISTTTVKAEGYRPMLLDVQTAPGETVTRSFTVNVRHGAADGDEHNSSLDTDGRLNLEFVGRNPSLMKLDIAPNPRAVTVYLAGDSTVCDHDDIPSAGWGQMLPILFKPGAVAVSNQATSGCTAHSFIEQRRLDSIMRTIKPGDYLFVQFGADDVKEQAPDAAAWKGYLSAYIDAAVQHHATPVLVTPVAQRRIDAGGKLVNTPGDFPQWTRELAAERKVALIDLNAAASGFLQQHGPEAFSDDTHFSAYGAYEMAKLVAQSIQAQHLDLAARLAGNIASNSDPAKFPASLGYDHLTSGTQR
jgi:lysophospholipase L1-like esterase